MEKGAVPAGDVMPAQFYSGLFPEIRMAVAVVDDVVTSWSVFSCLETTARPENHVLLPFGSRRYST